MDESRLDRFLREAEAHDEWDEQTLDAMASVWPNNGFKRFVGIILATINGMMLELSKCPISQENLPRLAELQGKIAGMREVLNILAEAMEKENESERTDHES